MNYPKTVILAMPGLLLAVVVSANADFISVSNVNTASDGGLLLDTVGATSAIGGTDGSLAVGDARPNGFIRPIVVFPQSGFVGIQGLPLASATLSFTQGGDSAELGDSYLSELRLFTADEFMGASNRDEFAALTGDGGDHTAVNSFLFENDMTGTMSVSFSSEALQGLFNAINGSDPIIGIAFREFLGDDHDAFLVADAAGGGPGGTVSIEVVAIPAPGAAALGVLGLGTVAWLRRRCHDSVHKRRPT